jgi:phage-related protein
MRRATVIAAALVAALAVGACGDSPEDEARDDGEAIGEAVRELDDATSPEQIQEAVADIGEAVDGMGEDARDAVREQVETQRDTLQDAAGAIQGADTSDLQAAIQQIRSQAAAFETGTDSVANEFWRGFDDGYDDGD